MPSVCDNIASHKRLNPADILDFAANGRLTYGDDDTVLFVCKPTDGSPSGRPPFDDPVRIYVPLLARLQKTHACHAEAYYHLRVTRTSKCFNGFAVGLPWKPVKSGKCTDALNFKSVRPPAKRFEGQFFIPSCPTALTSASVSTTVSLCR